MQQSPCLGVHAHLCAFVIQSGLGDEGLVTPTWHAEVHMHIHKSFGGTSHCNLFTRAKCMIFCVRNQE